MNRWFECSWIRLKEYCVNETKWNLNSYFVEGTYKHFWQKSKLEAKSLFWVLYPFWYAEESNSEPDVDLENQYYNSKALKVNKKTLVKIV